MTGGAHELIRVVSVPEVGLHAVIALHSTVAGPAFGGIRRLVYPTREAARADALALAEAMTVKCALAGLAAGGGKTTIAVPDGQTVDWAVAYRLIGDAVAALGGRYVCGPDVGTTERQLEWVRERTPHVNAPGNDAGASTAAGVAAGLRTIWSRLGTAGAKDRTVAVQGLGSVGLALVRRLLAEGAHVVGADLNPKAVAAAAALGVRIVSPHAILAQQCDVLMPCAMGHGLTESTVAMLRCGAVCGSANNQLPGPAAAWAMHRRGIVHAPDEVVSAGAVIEGVLIASHGDTPAARKRVTEKIAGLSEVLATVLETACNEARPPSVVARELARRRIEGLAAGRG